MGSREDKLSKLRSARAGKDMVIITDGAPFVEALQKKIDELKGTLGAGIDVNVDELVDALQELGSLKPLVEDLKAAVKEIKIPELPEKVELDGLNELVKVLAEQSRKFADFLALKPSEAKVKVDVQQIGKEGVDKLVGRIDDVIKAVKANAASQLPDEFIPVRRVRKIGSRLFFDDDAHSGGGGGGGIDPAVTRNSGTAIAVVNPDGSNVSGGSGSGGDGAIVDGASSSIKATVKDLTNSNPLATQIVDGAGDAITSFGGGTQYEDGEAAETPVGNVMMVKGGDGNVYALSTDGSVELPTTDANVFGAVDGLNSAVAEVNGTSLFNTQLVAADGTAVPADSTDGLLVNLGDNNDVTVSSSALPTGAATAANQSTVIGHLDGVEGLLTTIDTDTSALAGAVKAEDAVHSSGDSGIPLLTRRIDTASSSAGTSGDYATLNTDNTGRLWVNVGAVTASSQPLPTGASTSDKQDTIIGHLDGVEGLLTTIDADTGNAAAATHVEGTDISATPRGTLALFRDGSGLASPVSESAPLPVSIQSADVTIAADNVGLATEATLDSIDSNAATLAGAVSGTEMQVDVLTMPTTTVQATNLDIRGLTNTDVVTAELSAVDNAVLDAIAASLNTLDNVVSGSEAQVDVVAALPAGDNNIGNVDLASALPAGTNNIGDVDVASLAAGSNLIGDVGLSGARTSGGTTPYRNLDVDESEDEVKSTAGQVYWLHAINTTSAPLYLKFYNATAANVTVGTTTPVLTFPVPANADSDGAGFTLSIPNGVAFSTAITIAATTAVGDADTGAPGDNALIVNLGYA